MPGAPRRAASPADATASGSVLRNGLGNLAIRINDALIALGTQPAFAMAADGSMARPANPAWRSSTEAPTTRRPRPNRDSDAGDVEASQPDPNRDDSAEPDGNPDDVEPDHAETWRLVRRAQDGDGEAFGLIYDRYVDQVFRFIYYRVNDRALAEDFTSETFLRALRRIGSISYQGRDIGAWFVTIARNIVLDHLKSARNRLETTTADTIESREQERSTEAAVLDTLQSERLMQAVAQLGAEQRECVMLRFIHGLSVSETASVMNKNDGAVKALQHRAVRKLADLVGAELR